MPSAISAPTARIAIIGLGNSLLRDDGVGVHVVRALQQNTLLGPEYGPVVLAEVGTALLRALHLFEEADRIVAIDAFLGGGPPGTFYWLDPHEHIERGERPVSLHEWGLVNAIACLPETARPRIDILGIQPGLIEWGLELSPPLEAALPVLCGEIQRFVQNLRSET